MRTLGITAKPTTVKNPQANAIVKQLHKTMADVYVLRVMLYINRPENKLATTNMIDNNLATVVHTPRCTVNHTMRTSPGSMMFNRDTMVNVPFISNLIAI